MYENPHAVNQSRYQYQFLCNMWTGIIGDFLIGLVFLPFTLNDRNYTQFLEIELSILLQDVYYYITFYTITLTIRTRMWFKHDGAQAHFSRTARKYLNNNYTNR